VKQRFLNQKLGKRTSRRTELQKARNLVGKYPSPKNPRSGKS